MKIAIILMICAGFCCVLVACAQDQAAISMALQTMSKEPNPRKNESALRTLMKIHNLDSLKDLETIDMLIGTVAFSYIKAGNVRKFKQHLTRLKNPFNRTSYLNMGADLLLREGNNPAQADTLARRTVELYNAYKEDPSARPADFPLEDWKRFMKMAAFPYYSTYATVLHLEGDHASALAWLEKALIGQDMNDLQQATSELYSSLLELNGQSEKAYNILLKGAETGKSSDKMNTQLQKLHTKKYGSVHEADLFMENIKKNVDAAYRVEIRNKMITGLTAPAFNLFDTDGKPVALSNYKGKVVVLDFWATWCAPCIASMPAMEKMSNRDPDVVFLFIATQEKGENASERLRNYVKKTGFTGTVLLDPSGNTPTNNYAVAASYKVSSIPAKIVIDRHGDIRFTSTGFRSDAELTNELEAMIALAKDQSK